MVTTSPVITVPGGILAGSTRYAAIQFAEGERPSGVSDVTVSWAGVGSARGVKGTDPAPLTGEDAREVVRLFDVYLADPEDPGMSPALLVACCDLGGPGHDGNRCAPADQLRTVGPEFSENRRAAEQSAIVRAESGGTALRGRGGWALNNGPASLEDITLIPEASNRNVQHVVWPTFEGDGGDEVPRSATLVWDGDAWRVLMVIGGGGPGQPQDASKIEPRFVLDLHAARTDSNSAAIRTACFP